MRFKDFLAKLDEGFVQYTPEYTAGYAAHKAGKANANNYFMSQVGNHLMIMLTKEVCTLHRVMPSIITRRALTIKLRLQQVKD